MVTIEHIKATLSYLRADLHDPQEEAFESSQNKIISYKLKLALDSLQELFSRIITPEEMVAALPQFKDFFKQFWHETPWYMALPDHPILNFFCDIASLLAHENNKSIGTHDTPLGLMELMMPTIQLLSSSDHYPDLSPRWNPATQQWEDVDIKNIMKTHILGRNFTYLIPIKIILSLNNAEDPTLFNPYYNIEVHTPSETDNLSILSKEEIDRLQNYSTDTQSFFDNFEVHQTLLNEVENLLGYLTRLVNALKKNSIAGSGSEFSAGERGYIAIFNFMQIYDALSLEQKQEIPQGVKQEIEIIREQSSNKDKVGSTASCFDTRAKALESLLAIEENKAILNNIVLKKNEKNSLIKIIYDQLCICKEKIFTGLNGADPLFITNWGIEKIEDLHRINATTAPLIRDSIFTMSTIKGFFCSIIDLRAFIQTEPAEHLKLFLHFFAGEVLQAIVKYQSPEMYDLGDEDDYDDGSIQYTAEILSLLVQDLTLEKTELCFKYSSHFQGALVNLILDIEYWRNFIIFLKKCDGEQKKFFITKNKDLCLYTISHSPLLRKVTDNSVLEVLFLLHDQDYSIIFNMYDELLALNDFELTEYITMALNELESNNSTLLYQWIEKNAAIFLKKIKPYELMSVNFSQRDRLYQALESTLIANFQSSEDVKDTLFWLNPAQKDKFYKHIKWKIKFLIKTGKDVANILQYLDLEQYQETIPIIKESPHIFESFQDMEYCLENFKETKAIQLEQLLSDFYPIKSSGELVILLNLLKMPLSERKLSNFKFRLEVILRDAADFSVLFKKLSFKKLQIFFNAYQKDLINRSWSIDEAIVLAQFISPQNPLILSPELQKKLSQVVIHINFDVLYAKTRYDAKFYSVFSIFSLDHFKAIIWDKYNQIEAHLENTQGLFYFLSHLSKEQEVIIVDKWASSIRLFKKGSSLEDDFVYQANSTHKNYLLYPFFRARILSAPNYWDFELLNALCPSERNTLIKELGRAALLNHIKSTKDVSHLLSCLNREGCDLVLEMLNDDLARLINSPEDILIIKPYIAKSNANLPPELSMLLDLLLFQERPSLSPQLLEDPRILENSHKMMSGEQKSKVYRSKQAQEVPMAKPTPERDNINTPQQQSQLEALFSFTDKIITPRKPPIDYTLLDVEELKRWGEYPEYVFFAPVVTDDEITRKRKNNDVNNPAGDYKKLKRF